MLLVQTALSSGISLEKKIWFYAVSYTHLAGEFLLHLQNPLQLRKILGGRGIVLFEHFQHTPVSYTHLDVYKRQELESAGRLSAFEPIDLAVGLPPEHYGIPVSYTHLLIFI